MKENVMSLVHEIDYGTPRSRAKKTVTLTIDGHTVTVPEGTSIMRAAMEMGTQIPKLCATDMVEAFGRNRRARRHAGVLHHPGCRRNGGAHPDRSIETPAQRRHGALHL
jgi:hypothetical protein